MRLGVAALVLLLGMGTAVAQPKELVVAGWGGAQETGFRKSIIPRFERENNVRVIYQPGLSTQTLARLVAQRANPQIDVAMADDQPMTEAGTLGLVMPLDYARLPHAAQLFDIARDPRDFGIGFGINAAGLYYNTEVFAKNGWPPVSSVLDLFRPELKRKVTVFNLNNGAGLLLFFALNRALGGSEADFDPGFRKARDLSSQVITFDNFGETPTLIQQGAAVAGGFVLNRTAVLASQGVPVRFVAPKEGLYAWKAMIAIVKGRPEGSQALAYKFVDMMLEAEQQVQNARLVGFGPVNKDAKLDAETATTVVYGPDQMAKLLFPDWRVLGPQRPALIERWNREVEGK
jgi:putative spermidine/putrescine transport system substrate-binding protein